jgi:2-dehydropantoate 2-reductase
MNVLVVGSGAIGSLLAWALARGGANVWIVRRRGLPDPVEEELVVGRPDGTASGARVTAITEPGRSPVAPDLVVVAVKAYDVAAVLATLPPWPDATILTVQNGVGSEEVAIAARPAGPVIAGSVTASVELQPDGRVRWRRRGGIGLATVRGAPDELTERLVGMFAAAGLKVRRHADWTAMKWSKLLANLVGNATSALLDLDPGAVYADPRLFRIEREQLREAVTVMRRRNLRPVALPGANVPALVLGLGLPETLGRPLLARIVRGARGGKDPSLRLHLEGDRGLSEAAWMNGAVAREGGRLGVPAPVNAMLARLLDAAASDTAIRADLRHRPDRLVEELAVPAAPAPSGELGAGGRG